MIIRVAQRYRVVHALTAPLLAFQVKFYRLIGSPRTLYYAPVDNFENKPSRTVA